MTTDATEPSPLQQALAELAELDGKIAAYRQAELLKALQQALDRGDPNGVAAVSACHEANEADKRWAQTQQALAATRQAGAPRTQVGLPKAPARVRVALRPRHGRTTRRARRAVGSRAGPSDSSEADPADGRGRDDHDLTVGSGGAR